MWTEGGLTAMHTKTLQDTRSIPSADGFEKPAPFVRKLKIKHQKTSARETRFQTWGCNLGAV
jgi:hypothetical protein